MSQSEDLADLHRKRGNIKASLTRFCTFLENIKNAEPDKRRLTELELRLAKLESNLLTEFEDIQGQIQNIEKDQFNWSETEKFESDFFEALSNAKTFLSELTKSFQPQPIAFTADSNSVSHNTSPQIENKIHTPEVKLPTIELPKFNGVYERWHEFRTLFTSLIHDCESIKPISKFHYLRASLEGSAAECISSIEFKEENYQIAWDILNERFNNKRLAAHNHINSLINIRGLKPESATSLRNLIDTLSKHLRPLKNLGIPTDQWDVLLIFIIVDKLDTVTVTEWEDYKLQGDLPTLTEFKSFLKDRADRLEKIELHSKKLPKAKYKENKVFVANSNQKTFACFICNKDHSIYSCPEFSNMSVQARQEKVRILKLCNNCLRNNHKFKDCKSIGCRKCNGKHHTLLHLDQGVMEQGKPNQTENNARDEPEKTNSYHSGASNGQVLLSTAIVDVIDINGKRHSCRAMLDNGSMSNFISEKLFHKLNLRKKPTRFSVIGIGQVESTVNSSCEVELHSKQASFNTRLRCLIIPKITENLPNVYFERSTLNVPQNLSLADPKFNEPGDIDLLIGAGTFWNLLGDGNHQLGKNGPVMHNTKLGWIISGCCNILNENRKTVCNFNKLNDVQAQLAKFWEIEEIPGTSGRVFSDEEQKAETHFANTFKRNADGRFIVSIPLKEPATKLGDSKQTALKQFYNLERKLSTNPKLKRMYVDFMHEYEELSHMSKFELNSDQPHYFSPHHGVLKEDSATTKLRVVFNSSAITTSGVSYNNLQMVGPTIQEDLVSILLRFREHAFVVSADIAKMYRQVAIDDKFKPLQLILWRPSPDRQLSTYSLNTVTYGTASASFLAVRCLEQLAIDHKVSNPKAASVIHKDFYVDDLLTGADSVEETIDLCQQVSAILKSGCFNLRKWKSNCPEILDGIKETISSSDTLHFGPQENTKTLGLLWACRRDAFSFQINTMKRRGCITKRVILSETAQIFDPIGLISPCIVTVKIMLQSLWSLKLSWDEPVPDNISTKFIQFRTEIESLNSLNIPRHVLCRNPTSIELHGFADASQRAYGCCIYLRSIDRNDRVHVNLLCSKTRVAPIKSISIPRLELCAAQMLARLCEKVKKSMTINIDDYFLWSDSTVALCWIRTSPHVLQTFVANRVADIQDLTGTAKWRYVPTEHNPADDLSRGLSPNAFINSKIWFPGPLFLKMNQNQWPIDISLTNPLSDLPEIRKQTINLVEVNSEKPFPFNRFSSLTRIKRTTAYIMRFISNCRTPKAHRLSGALSLNEINGAFLKLIKMSQRESFPSELSDLNKNSSVSRKSKILNLTPFLDDENVIRVGGRLKHSPYSFEKKHPAILSSKHALASLILKHEHLKLLHAGPQSLLAATREFIWTVSGKTLAKKIVRECVVCCRYKPRINPPLMGNLPKPRVTPKPPFDNTGVDYAGPFTIKDRKGRGCKTLKCYLCLFVCLSTRAVHLECVTELSTSAFLETFQRFVSRRGMPSHVYSDNGTNFVGAHAQLKELGNFLRSKSEHLTDTLQTTFNFHWHFIPAYSPHMGGLWEAGVKSAKHHIKRIMSNTLLTYESFYSLITQIEGILNSRPLTPLSTDPNDLEALTPAHFLIGRSLQAVPYPDLQHISTGRLSHFQHLQQLKQHFWTRWSKEYLSQLQQRSKWRMKSDNLQIGDMVLIKDDHLPPARWQLGRIQELHPGSDNIVRVVSVKTGSDVIKRPVVKICPLPISNL